MQYIILYTSRNFFYVTASRVPNGEGSENTRGSTQDYRLGGGVLLGPLAANTLRILLVLLVVLRNIGRERVVRVRC